MSKKHRSELPPISRGAFDAPTEPTSFFKTGCAQHAESGNCKNLQQTNTNVMPCRVMVHDCRAATCLQFVHDALQAYAIVAYDDGAVERVEIQNIKVL